MFGIKKKGRQAAAKYHGFLSQLFNTQKESWRKKTRFEGRKRLTNIWAKKHPYRIVAIYGILAVVLISWNVVEYIYFKDRNEDKTEYQDLKATRTAFNSISVLANNEEIMREEISNLGMKGEQMLEELDSLCKLQSKSHADSIRIFSICDAMDNAFNINTTQYELKKH